MRGCLMGRASISWATDTQLSSTHCEHQAYLSDKFDRLWIWVLMPRML